MKVTKSQLKELIRHAIVEDIMDKEIENPKTGNKIKIKTALQLPDEHPANKKAKDMVAKSSPEKSDEPTDATPAPKGKPKGPMKNPFSKESPAYEPKQKEIDKEKKNKKSVKESKKRRYTVKEVRMWMKKLEENRYKKVYNSDARRVAWMVNNEGVELSEMPKSMSKKWTKAQYGRERYLATEFLKSKSEQMNEAINVKKMVKAVNKGEDVVVYDKKGKKYSLQSGDNKAVAVTDYLGSEKI